MTYETILYEEADGVATVTLNRPDKLNAVTGQMLDELKDAVARAGASPDVRCLLLTGAGRGFCAGQDLSDRAVASERPDLSQTLGQGYNPLIKAITELPMPVVCAVNGIAAGAGANIALACDIVLAKRSAKFMQAFAKIGLIPDSGGTWHLPRMLGLPRALGLAMLAEPISAEQAVTWGLIWQAVDDDMLMIEANAFAKKLATQPTRGLAEIKRAMRASFANTLDEQLALEAGIQGELGRGHDYGEGISAFMEKREAKFTGE